MEAAFDVVLLRGLWLRLLWWKYFTNLPTATIALLTPVAVNPSLTARFRVCAKLATDFQLTRVGLFAWTMFLALS